MHLLRPYRRRASVTHDNDSLAGVFIVSLFLPVGTQGEEGAALQYGSNAR